MNTDKWAFSFFFLNLSAASEEFLELIKSSLLAALEGSLFIY